MLLLDPKWKHQKDALVERARKESAFADDVEANLASFVAKRCEKISSRQVQDERHIISLIFESTWLTRAVVFAMSSPMSLQLIQRVDKLRAPKRKGVSIGQRHNYDQYWGPGTRTQLPIFLITYMHQSSSVSPAVFPSSCGGGW